MMLTSVAMLSAAVTTLTDTFPLKNFSASGNADDRVVGGLVFLDDEICVITEILSNSVKVGRGCWDTVPAPHDIDTIVWFPDAPIAQEPTARLGGETVSVKLLTNTTSSGPLPIEGAPPNGLTLNFRFARPYPPGLMTANGSPWFSATVPISFSAGGLVLAWAHRDRVLQADQLVPHSAASVGPEPGVTYRARVYRTTGNTLVATHAALPGPTWTYTLAQAQTDFRPHVSGVIEPGYVILESVRDGLASLQNYRINFTIDMKTMLPRNTSFARTFSRPTVTTT